MAGQAGTSRALIALRGVNPIPAFRRVCRMQYGRVLKDTGIRLTPELGRPPVSKGVVYDVVDSQLVNSDLVNAGLVRDLVDFELDNSEVVNSEPVNSELVSSDGQGRCRSPSSA